MPSWLNTIIDLWPIASTITPLILLGGFYWLQTKFPSKTDFSDLSRKVDTIEIDQIRVGDEIKKLREDRDSPPTRMELLSKIAGVEGRVSAVETGLASINTQLKTANEYLQILVERGLER